MKLWCLDDKTGWGRRIVEAAVARKHRAALFLEAQDHIRDGYAFLRLELRPPRLHFDREQAEILCGRGLTLVPDIRQLRHYEDKAAQADFYRGWMPKTLYIESADMAAARMTHLGFPFISKSKHGSASANVRLIDTPAAAFREIDLAFHGAGILARDGAQTGYVLWQEYLPNEYDYRVHIVGREIAIARRYNKPGTVFASGHGDIENVSPDDDAETHDALMWCRQFFAATGLTFAAIDILKDPDGGFKFIETSIAWPQHHASFSSRRFVSGRPCADLFEVIIEEMEAGVFG